ncbi:hypothetical protein Acr_05g0002150 [Actinidia rufa]|uniref:Reverse transcriptase zinc-binding domain-containing protein n=1 Tax=Actinidia rufa TaxID=165716 RepID=A0A7J0EK47_9ERIC|nr:hypothetical protein Acr_05g0002150 [Actinidia rufa]
MAKGKNKHNNGGQGALVANEASTDLYESDRDDLGEEPNPEAAAVIPSVMPPAPELPTKVSPPGVRPNAIVKTGNTQGESSAAGEERDAEKAHKENKSYASLLTGNRMPSKGSQLQFFDQDEGPVIIEEEDIQGSDFLSDRCLVGYFGGRFPGKQALKHITNSWKVQVSVKHHGSGWLIFQSSSTDDKSSVLENGPYIIYGRPLLLKAMPRFFRFGNEAISSFPVWVQLRYVPLDMWYPNVFGKICSKLGKPIHMDKMTSRKERVNYARCLVETDMSKEIKHTVTVTLNLSGGRGEYEQPIFYENLPKFCTHCKIMGHTQESCKANKESVKPADIATEKGKETGPTVAATDGQTGTTRTGTNKGNQLEWVTKQPKTSKGQKGRSEAVQNPGPTTCNKFSPLEIIQESKENTNTRADQSKENQVEWANNERNAKGHAEDTNARLETEDPTQITESSSKQSQDIPIQHQTLEDGENTTGHKTPESRHKTPVLEDKQQKKNSEIAAGIPQNKMQQLPKVQNGRVAAKRRNPTQPVKRSITGILAAKNSDKPHLPSTSNQHVTSAKGEEGKKKRDKKAPEKNGNATPFAEFCAEMGGDTPTPIKFDTGLRDPWLILGDFNNVLTLDERSNGQPVSPYEIRDFHRCCSNLGLVDTPYSGAFLTWTNTTTWCKLDRALVNSKWVMEGLRAHANFDFPGKLSDHSPCVVSLFENSVQGVKTFKFFNMWALNEDFQGIVDTAWAAQIQGSAMFRLCKKLKSLKEPLKVLNKKQFSHISSRAAAAEEKLCDIQQQLHDNTSDPLLQEQLVQSKSSALRLAEAEQSFCSQIAKMKFLKESDKGSKFFHDLIKSNKSRSQIVSLPLSDGSRSTSLHQVANAFLDFYKGLLGTSSPCSQLVNSILLDGEQVSEAQASDLIRAVSDEEIKSALFSIGDDKSLGPDGFSAYFYKKAWGSVASRVEDYRPIACCNVSYKVISKILAARLVPVMAKLIDPAQSAFVQGRTMVENVYLVQELLKRYGWRLSFPRLFIDWIMQCVTTTSYSLSINGSLHGFFKGDEISVQILLSKLVSFGECSGLKMSLQKKSSIYAAGMSCADLDSIKSSSLLSEGKFPFRYLGLPVAASKLTIAQFHPFMDRSSGYITSWAGMTYAGRSELIRSVLQGVECFWLSSLPMPVGVRDKINRMCRNFLWGSKCCVVKKALVAWDDICLPKKEGGLGFKNGRRFIPGSKNQSGSVGHQWEISSKAAYEFFRPRKLPLTWPNLVWHSSIIPRHSFIMWLGLKERLQTKDKLHEFIDDKVCPLCAATDESIDHLFFQCDIGKHVWFLIKQWLKITRAMSTLKSATKWLIKEARGTGIQSKA